MKLFELFSEADFNEQRSQGMIKVNPHPFGRLMIVNYTQKAQFTPELWNHVTDTCRGLIYDSWTMEVIARPFKKFWNYGDSRHPETMPDNFPSYPPTITRKMDGSLGILFYWGGKWQIATRGSFDSTQAVWATKWIQEHPPVFGEVGRAGWTPLFEIVYPENQIVVKYDYSGLVLLALVNIEDGSEMSRSGMVVWANANGFKVVEQFHGPVELLKQEDDPNEEGYVVSWDQLGAPPIRVKIKFNTYCRLHKLLTQTNAVTVWEMLRDGLDVDTLTVDVPEEFKGWINSVRDRVRKEYAVIEKEAIIVYEFYKSELDPKSREGRKAFAAYASGYKSAKMPVTHILFRMLDGVGYEDLIYKLIRPSGTERPFREADE